MLKTGLANMGIAIAIVGAVITAVIYEAASGGGTYVVTYDAIFVVVPLLASLDQFQHVLPLRREVD